jgi:hypothetical protein
MLLSKQFISSIPNIYILRKLCKSSMLDNNAISSGVDTGVQMEGTFMV